MNVYIFNVYLLYLFIMFCRLYNYQTGWMCSWCYNRFSGRRNIGEDRRRICQTTQFGVPAI
jgi:hypothetical protein